MRNLKRLTCLFMALHMLLTPVLAATDTVEAGTGGSSAGSGTFESGGSKWSSRTGSGEAAGLLLHVQDAGGQQVIFQPTDEDGSKEAKNYIDIVKYWTSNFPDTNPNNGQTGIYLLPTWSKAEGEPAAIKNVEHGTSTYDYEEVYRIWMTATSDNLINKAAKTAYAAAKSNISDVSPNLSLPAEWTWSKYINDNIAELQAVVPKLFSASSASAGYRTATDIEKINTRISAYLQQQCWGDTDDQDKQSVNTGLFFNYCSLLASVIACLPEDEGCHERTAKAQQLDVMCQDFFGGSQYTPMFVTGEIVVASEFNDKGRYCVWWTPQQCLSAVTGSDCSGDSITAGADPVKIVGARAAEYKHPETKQVYYGKLGAGGLMMYGRPNEADYATTGFTQYGTMEDNKTLWDGVSSDPRPKQSMPVYGNIISSVGDGLYSKYDGKGLSKSTNGPIRGFGVWGLSTDPPAPPTPVPPIKGDIGTVSLSVDQKPYVNGVGSYNETFTVNLDINLDPTYSSDIPESVAKENGASFANCLLWLYQMKQAGKTVPNPYIDIWISQASPASTFSADAAVTLKEQTYGYSKDGTELGLNLAGQMVSPDQLERSLGAGFTWVPENLTRLVYKNSGLDSDTVSVYNADNGALRIEIKDLLGAWEHFRTNGATLSFKGEFQGNGTLADENSKVQHWWRAGANVAMMGPTSLQNMTTLKDCGAGLRCTPKYDYVTVLASPEDKPFYYSAYQQPYSELKQGDIYAEQFNSMTGTPTNTNGHYYQYFASGGSEFVVQFDGEYVESADASRTYTASFSGVHCDLYHTEAHISCPGHTSTDSKGNTKTTYCSHHGCPTHATCTSNHTVSDTFTWTQQVKGFSYVKIKNLKVWKLSEARLDGTRDLLDTNEVTATIQSNSPNISYNVAAADNSASGRLVYTYNTTQNDTAKINGYPKSSNNSCSSHTSNNQKTLDGDTASLTCGATCVSDFIVLHTTHGDQSILYYEYKSKSNARINKGNCVAEDIVFDKVPYATIWTNNTKTSAGSKMPEDGITYGGYNGNYTATTTKYDSSGHASNITFSTTTAAKNVSKAFTHLGHAVTGPLRLINNKLVIPDTKQNGEYTVGNSSVFYESILNIGPDSANYGITAQAQFGGKKGFVVRTTYGDGFDKINDVVVYDPVSSQNAIVVSLPEERDQRVAPHPVAASDKNETCPGDASCAYLKNECSVTQHTHTEECYQQVSYEVHGHDTSVSCQPQPIPQGTTKTFSYTGGIQSITLNPGTYRLEVWGAQGGDGYCSDSNGWSASSGYIYQGGGGGYSQGTISIQTVTTFYIGVGGEGLGATTTSPYTSSNTAGGYNGGGTGNGGPRYFYSHTINDIAGGGGGATHIATSPGTLPGLVGKANTVLLVAGGGGGATALCAGRTATATGWECIRAINGSSGAQAYFDNSGQNAREYYSDYITSQFPSNVYPSATTITKNATAGVFGQGGSGACSTPYAQYGDYAWWTSFAGGGGGGGYYGGGGGGGGYLSTGPSGQGACYCGGPGGGGSGYVSTQLTSTSRSGGVNSGNGYAKITAIAVKGLCYTVNKSVLSCTDPHHACSYNWKLYTNGLKHISGKICTGRGCTDTSALLFPTQEQYTIAQCAAGNIVQHAGGDIHLSTTTGICSYCGTAYTSVLSTAQTTDRTPDPSEYKCYAYGDTRCWKPCGDPTNHNKKVTEVTVGDATYRMGSFINLDWPFTIYFPNTGDFYGTGAKWSTTTSAERGWGYTNDMDCTEWTVRKWVEFPFDVIHAGVTYLAYEPIALDVRQTEFEFYLPLNNFEMANAEVKMFTTAINDPNPDFVECGTNRDQNLQPISYNGRPLSHHHDSDKRTYIDVVGRIGALTLEDTGDFRFSNLFKKTTNEWLVKNIVRRVDPTKQSSLLTDPVDVRGVLISETGVAGNTYGTKAERNVSTLYTFPLTPTKNNITALRKQPLRLGYDSFFDLSTLGNYYGNASVDDSGSVVNQDLVLVKPHYYRLDLANGAVRAVDVYMDSNGKKVLINDADKDLVTTTSTSDDVSLDWTDEHLRRNYNASESGTTKAVEAAYSWVEPPSGMSWVYGNYDVLNLTQRNRTFIGSQLTYGTNTDPSERIPDVRAALQGQRWHFNIGLPSSAVFVYSGEQPTQANIDKCCSGNQAVILCALEIYAQGEVWTLTYDGKTTNKGFTVLEGGTIYDPVITYPSENFAEGMAVPEMPIVEVISINKSSKDDLNTAGTH